VTVERVLLVVFALGTWMTPDAPPARDAALLPRREPHLPWRSVDAKHWQITSDAAEDPAVTDAAEGTRGACPAGMVEVRGQAKVEAPGALPIEELQNATCTSWIQREFPERCASFDAERWAAAASALPTAPMHFCIDRFEYPNVRGQYPVIMVSWHEASRLCAAQSKRLCGETEWTFACEGEDALPYPYGTRRDATACVIDRTWLPYHEAAFRDRAGDAAMRELDALWQGVASGTSPRCKSPFGVYDMTGNVDEWTRSAHAEGQPSILKGGYWGPVRGRCRAATRVHDADYVFYQEGFRCCADAPPETSGDADAEADAEAGANAEAASTGTAGDGP
jgi:hypothetical protein